MATKTPVSQTAEMAEKKTFVQKLSDFIRRRRTPILAVTGSMLGAILIVGVYSAISNSRSEAAAVAMEQAREKISAWSSEKDETKKADLKKALIADLDRIEKSWGGSFQAQESLFIKAGIAVQDKDYEAAEKGYSASASMRKSYLTPIALEAAAVAAEERGAADKAIDYYGRIVKDFKDVTPNLPHAYFSLGRLAEGKSDWSGAVAQYEKLRDAFPDSDWTKLAKDRLIYIRSAGLVK